MSTYTTDKATLSYYGVLESLDENSNFVAANGLFAQYSDVIVDIPLSNTNPPTATSSTAVFFDVISRSPTPVWVRVSLTAGATTNALGQARVQAYIETIAQWFKDRRLSDRLAGFCLTQFGFGASYADQVFVTRADQLFANRIAHNVKKPIMAAPVFIGDIDTEVGPGNRGSERGLPLWPAILGTQINRADKVLVLDPLWTSWAGTTPTADPAKILDVMGTVKRHYEGRNNRYPEVVLVQSFNLATSPLDNLVGLQLDSAIATHISNFCEFTRALGFKNIGGQGIPGVDNPNKALPAHYFTRCYTTAHQGEGLAQLFSLNGEYRVVNQRLVDGVLTRKAWRFSSAFAYIADDTVVP